VGRRQEGVHAPRDPHDHGRRPLVASPGLPKSRILIHDARSEQPVLLAPESSLILTGPRAECGDVLLFEHQRLPPTQTPDMFMTQHLLSVQLRPPTVLESHGAGAQRRNRLAPGDVWFKAAGSPGRYAWREPTEVFDLGLAPGFVDQVALREHGAVNPELVGERAATDPQVLHISRALRSEIVAGSPGGRLFVDALATALAIYGLEHYAAFPRRPPPARGLDPRSVRAVTEYVRENLDADLTLAELAQVVHLSPYHFARAFKAAAGLTPHRYVTRCRVDEAKRLLTTRRLTVDAVARRVGFANGSHLARAFRRLEGVTPSAFARAPGRSAARGG
jgi:AraC family transcriptional regulator